MAGFVFISNSTKPTREKARSRDAVRLSNVSRPCLQAALNMGYEVYLGVNRDMPEKLECELPVHLFDSHTYRNITALKDNLTAYDNLNRILEKHNIDVIHCNTPVGGLIGRLSGRKHHVRKIIYTAHGFHFYKGAPLFNRTVLKLAERVMAHWTDAIVTMNQEDFEAAKRFRLKKNGKVYLVHGVGINLSEFDGLAAQRSEKRAELGLSENDVALISAGDLVARKNYSLAIAAVAKAQNKHLHYFICGCGEQEGKLRALAKHAGVENYVHFLGFRSDMKELMAASDIFLFTTLQEGLPRSLMEAMASGLPCIVSNIRGNVDLIKDGVGGYLCSPNDTEAFAFAISKLGVDMLLRQQMAEHNLSRIMDFDISIVEKEIAGIYTDVLSLNY